jgi:threonine synthase
MDNHIAIAEHSLLTYLKCPECGAVHNASVINTVCGNIACRSTLFAQYDLSTGLNKKMLLGRSVTMWRYRELLPVIDEKNIVTLGEGFTR